MIARGIDARTDAIIGANLRRLREDACLDVPRLAALLGMGPERLAAAEAGAAHLTIGDLLAAGERLHFNIAILFDDLPPPGIPS